MADVFIKRTDGKSDRPPVNTGISGEDPIALLLDELQDLSIRLRHNGGDGINILERYDFFIRHSTKGRACTYAHKCKQLFLLSDFQQVRDHILKILSIIRRIPGEEDFG